MRHPTCPHCRAPIRAEAFEPALDTQRRWLVCPACDSLIPQPGPEPAEPPLDPIQAEFDSAAQHA